MRARGGLATAPAHLAAGGQTPCHRRRLATFVPRALQILCPAELTQGNRCHPSLFFFFFFTQISPLDVRKVPGLFAHAPGARVSLSFRAAFQVRYSHMPTCLSLAHMALKPCTLRDRFAVDTVPIRFHLTAPPAAPAACYRLSLLIFFSLAEKKQCGTVALYIPL